MIDYLLFINTRRILMNEVSFESSTITLKHSSFSGVEEESTVHIYSRHSSTTSIAHSDYRLFINTRRVLMNEVSFESSQSIFNNSNFSVVHKYFFQGKQTQSIYSRHPS